MMDNRRTSDTTAYRQTAYNRPIMMMILDRGDLKFKFTFGYNIDVR